MYIPYRKHLGGAGFVAIVLSCFQIRMTRYIPLLVEDEWRDSLETTDLGLLEMPPE
jgi:hypothetical protein